jgi:lactoylglutathione lyase
MISRVGQVILPVDDQEGAKHFWTAQVGLELIRDETFGGERWIELTAAGGEPRIVLSARREGEVRPEAPEKLPHSPVFFECDDIEQTHAELAGRGVRFPVPPRQMHFGWWSMFEDHEGTRYALGQRA